MYLFRDFFKKVWVGCLLALPSFVFSADFEWKGLYQASHYFMYEKIDFMHEGNTVGNYYVLPGETIDIRTKYMVEMTPVIRISDGLRFESTISFSRLFLNEEDASIESNRYLDGTRYKGRPTAGTDSSLGAELMRFYGVADFEDFSVYVGRMPYNFGLGMTYSDGLSYKALAYNVRDAVVLKFKSDDFYFKPALSFRGINSVDLILEAGYKQEDYGVAVLVDESIYRDHEERREVTGYFAGQHDGVTRDNLYYPGTLNAYGYYNVNEDLRLAAEVGSYLSDWLPSTERWGGIIDVFWNTGYEDVFVNVMAAYAKADYDLNPNWTPVNALLDYRHYSNETDTGRMKDPASMAFTNGIAATGILGKNFNDQNSLSLLYAFMNDNMHEFLLIHTFKTNRGFYLDNFIGFVLVGPQGELSFNQLPVLQAMVRMAYVF